MPFQSALKHAAAAAAGTTEDTCFDHFNQGKTTMYCFFLDLFKGLITEKLPNQPWSKEYFTVETGTNKGMLSTVN